PVLGDERRGGLDGVAVVAVQLDQCLRHRGQVLRQVVDLPGGDVGVDRLVQQCLSDVGDKSGGVVVGEELGVHTERFGDAKQYRNGQRTGVVLDLVEVTRRDFEQSSQLGLA